MAKVRALSSDGAGGEGLRFPDQGLKVLMPLPVSRLSLTLGQFASPIQISLPSGAGAVVDAATTTRQSAYSSHPFALRKKASLVTLCGGMNGGILSQICITF